MMAIRRFSTGPSRSNSTQQLAKDVEAFKLSAEEVSCVR